ncbi:hypothetical protein GQX74_001808 [Glossina fuscipes]|nr:hypothetical protein GQX74_001808 [Glossina fuscipes]
MMAENNQGFEFGCDVKGEAKTLPQFRCQQEEFYQSSEPGTSFFVFVLTLSCKQLRHAVRRAAKKWRGMSDWEKQTRSEQKHSWDLMRFLVACYKKSLTPYEREFK